METKPVSENNSESLEILPLYIKDIHFCEADRTLLTETMNDLLAAYFTETDDEIDGLEYRIMVYDNYVNTIHVFLARRLNQEPKSGDKFQQVAERIAYCEKKAYEMKYWPNGSPVEQPMVDTGEIEITLGSVAAEHLVAVGDKKSSSVNSDELVLQS